jgi:kelch-like protein 9/13
VATYAHNGCSLNNVAYIIGGYCHGSFIQHFHAYNPALDQWDTLPPMSVPRGWHCVSHFNEELIYVFGGCFINHNNTNQQQFPQLPNSANYVMLLPHQQHELTQPVMTTECYNVRTNQWTTLKPITNMHKEASCVRHADGVFIIGGYNMHTKTGQRLISRYEFGSDSWSTVGQMPGGMTGVGVCFMDLPWHFLESENGGQEEERSGGTDDYIWSRIDVDSGQELSHVENGENSSRSSFDSNFNTSESESDRDRDSQGGGHDLK